MEEGEEEEGEGCVHYNSYYWVGGDGEGERRVVDEIMWRMEGYFVLGEL